LATLEAGSNLLVSPPVVTEDLSACKELVMIAGGSAITVAMQLCEDALLRNPKDVPVQLIMCNHAVEDVLYLDILEGFLEKYPTFELVNCISSQLPTELPGKKTSRTTWHQGRLSKDVIKITKPGTQGFVSGPRGLCKAAMTAWEAAGQDMKLLHVLDEVDPPAAARDESAVSARSDVQERSAGSQDLSAPLSDRSASAPDTLAPDVSEPAMPAPPEAEKMSLPAVAAPMPAPVVKKVEPPASGGIFHSFFKAFSCTCSKVSDEDDSEGAPMIAAESS